MSYVGVEPQGSYGLRTIIKPVKEGQEYDADVQLYMAYDEDKSPKEYIDEFTIAFEATTYTRTKCIAGPGAYPWTMLETFTWISFLASPSR